MEVLGSFIVDNPWIMEFIETTKIHGHFIV